MNIVFREYQEKDKYTLLSFINKLEEYAKSIDPIKRVKNLPGFAHLELEDTLGYVKKHQGKIWFIEYEGEVIGYMVGVIWKQSKKARLEIGVHKQGEVMDLYLEEPYRKQGLGSKMLQMMEKYFKENGCDSMWVQVFSPNTNAHDAYKKFGFIDREIGMLKEI